MPVIFLRWVTYDGLKGAVKRGLFTRDGFLIPTCSNLVPLIREIRRFDQLTSLSLELFC